MGITFLLFSFNTAYMFYIHSKHRCVMKRPVVEDEDKTGVSSAGGYPSKPVFEPRSNTPSELKSPVWIYQNEISGIKEE